MPVRGLSLPIRATPAGRSAISSGSEQAEKILAIALSDCDNNNAFQQGRGLESGDVLFGVPTVALQAQVQQRLTAIFRQFERDARYKLLDDTVSWLEGPEEGELTLSLEYIDLESDERRTFARSFSGKGA